MALARPARLRALSWLRLGLFPLGYGLTGAFVGGTLNRVMIAELGLPASLVGAFLAVPLLESPVRLWVGYRSDGHPIRGLRREPYILLGSLLSGAGAVAATVFAVRAGRPSAALAAGGLLAFLLYGFGRNLGHNIFQALVADSFPPPRRSRAVTAYELASLLGLVFGAGALGKALEVYDPRRLVAVSIGVGLAALLLSIAAALGQERRDEAAGEAVRRARAVPFGRAVREVLTSDPQVRRFFLLVVLTVLGTMAQDVLLEPYGALALGMPVGQTTRLTMYWGLGVMASMLLSGTLLIPRLGHVAVLRAGLAASMAAFGGILALGAAGGRGSFQLLVLAMGLGTGLAGAGMLTGAVLFTTTVRAGLLMGAWGMANLLGKALGGVMGGAVVDGLQVLTGGNALVSYGAVFGAEAALLAAALALSFGLDPGASRAREEEQSAALAQGDSS